MPPQRHMLLIQVHHAVIYFDGFTDVVPSAAMLHVHLAGHITMNTLLSLVHAWLRRFIPEPLRVSQRERLRASIGALFGIGLTGLIATWLFGLTVEVPLLVAPMGASAVLLFAAPASPLAQPWSIIGGNLVAALVGVTCAHLIANPLLAAALAVSLSIAIMFALRCLHPPSGAIALTAVLGGPAIHALGYGFVLSPVLLNSVLLLACALLYHGLTRHRYPHAIAPVTSTVNTPPARHSSHSGITRDDIEAALASNEELLSVSVDDLQRILETVASNAYHRRLRDTLCQDIMQQHVYTLAPDTTLADAWKKMNRYKVKAFPVVDNNRQLLGIVTRDDIMQRVRLAPGRRLLPAGMQHTTINLPANATIERLMNTVVDYVQTDTPIAQLIGLFSRTVHHHFPVLDHDRRVVGMVTPADLVEVLHGETLHV